MNKELIVDKDPKSPISEIFRTLRTNIQFMSKDTKTILITSTYSGEGKSWIASNLAVTFAQTGKKVLIIDADMRKGRQYAIFNISPKPGLSNYLSGIDDKGETDIDEKKILDYIQKTEVKHLYAFSAGNIPPNPSELLLSLRMNNLLKEVKKLFDIIIIDSTPTQLVADALILAPIVDATVVVVACKETKKEDLKRIITGIKNVNGKIAGVILNKIPMSAKKYEQRYYYSGNVTNNSKMFSKRENNNDNDSKDETRNIRRRRRTRE